MMFPRSLNSHSLFWSNAYSFTSIIQYSFLSNRRSWPSFYSLLHHRYPTISVSRSRRILLQFLGSHIKIYSFPFSFAVNGLPPLRAFSRPFIPLIFWTIISIFFLPFPLSNGRHFYFRRRQASASIQWLFYKADGRELKNEWGIRFLLKRMKSTDVEEICRHC